MIATTIAMRRFGLALAIFVLAVGAGVTGAALDNSHLGVVGGAALVILAALPLVARLRVDPIDGPGLAALVTAFELGFVSLAWLGSPPGQGPGLSRADVVAGLLVVALGLASFWLGARLCGPPRPRRPLTLSLAEAPSPAVLMLAFACGVVGTVIGVVENSFGYVAGGGGPAALGEVFALLESLGSVVALVTALLYFCSGGRQLGRLTILFTLGQFAIGFLSGVKAAAVAPLILVGLAYVVVRGRVPWRMVLVVILFTFLIVIPFAEVYRSAARTGSAAEALSQSFASRSSGLGQAFSRAYRYGIVRFRNIDSVALIVARTPSVFPYAGGTEYFELPGIILVPRALWPHKPSLTQGLDFSHTYWQVPISLQTSTPLTQSGDLYRNFGLIGVVIGLLAWGLVVGGWQRLVWRRHSPRFTVVFIYSIVYTIANIEVDLPDLIAEGSKALPTVALVAWLLLPGRGGEPGYRVLAGIRRGRRDRPHPNLGSEATPR